MMKEICATETSGQNLKRSAKTIKIGEIRDDVSVMDVKGHMMPCTLLVWDFYADGKVDYFYFNDEKLLFVSINESRADSTIRLFSDLIKKGAGLDEMVESVRNEFNS